MPKYQNLSDSNYDDRGLKSRSYDNEVLCQAFNTKLTIIACLRPVKIIYEIICDLTGLTIWLQ